MIDVQVLGIGCVRCRRTLALVEEVVRTAGLDAVVRKVDDPQAFVTYGVMRPPAVVVDGRLVHVGSVPSRSQVAGWIQEVTTP